MPLSPVCLKWHGQTKIGQFRGFTHQQDIARLDVAMLICEPLAFVHMNAGVQKIDRSGRVSEVTADEFGFNCGLESLE